MNTINIKTSQNIELGYELGSVGDRMAGAVLDWLCIIAYVVILLVIANLTSYRESHFLLLLFFLFLPVVFYDLASEILLNGQSLGKKVMGIKVISISGEQPSLGQYLIRWVFRLVDFTFTSNLLGLVLVAATEKHQRLGDIIAGTVIVKTKPGTTVDDTWYQPTEGLEYQTTYPEVIHLSDNDVQLIKEVIINVDRQGNMILANEAQRRIEEVLNINSKNNNPRLFLQTILSDYNYLTSRL